MQHFILLLSVLFATLGLASSLTVGSQAVAESWISAHPAQSQDELAELKSENPEAYAIVKALLTKRSLGLLDPKHPTASFAAPAHLDDMPVGAAAFAKLATSAMTSKASVGLVHHDWLNWKPSSTALSDDDAAVQDVLGDASELTSSRLRGGHSTDSATQANDLRPETKPVVAEMQQNSYLKDSDLVATTAPPGGYLASFSWGDHQPARPIVESVAPPSIEHNAQPEGKPKVSVLSSWLFGEKTQEANTIQAPVKQQATNYYTDLWKE